MTFRSLSAGFAVLVLFLLSHATSSAQPVRMSPGERTAELKKELGLTDQQATNVKAILEEQQREMQKVFEGGDEREVRREKMIKITRSTDEKIMALLTEGQKKRYEELLKERRSRFEERRRKE